MKIPPMEFSVSGTSPFKLGISSTLAQGRQSFSAVYHSLSPSEAIPCWSSHIEQDLSEKNKFVPHIKS